MTIKDQALASGLAFAHVHNNQEPQWNSQELPPLLGGWRSNHASVVLDQTAYSGTDEIVAVFGGRKQNEGITNSVILLNLGEEVKEWREGPRMNEERLALEAVVCDNFVYAIGGSTRRFPLDTIERINVTDLLHDGSNSNNSQWMTLNCRLCATRDWCAATVVQNRFIVVIGGYQSYARALSAVDVIDTGSQTITSGPPLNVARYDFGVSVIGRRIYVVGGCDGHGRLNSLEVLEFNEEPVHGSVTGASVVPFSSSWNIHEDLYLRPPRYLRMVVNVGSCLIVAGGDSGSIDEDVAITVEVLDTKTNVIWSLPQLTTEHYGGSMVSVSDGILVMSGHHVDTCEKLSLVDKNTWIYTCLLAMLNDIPIRSLSKIGNT